MHCIKSVEKGIARLVDILRTVRLQPFETGTPAGRSRERHRRASLTALASALSQGVRVLTTVITVPLALGYLGDERFGAWLIMSSMLAFLGFADLGIGNGLLNIISEAHGKGDRQLAGKAVSSAFVVLSGIALLLGLLFWLGYGLIPWTRVFNVKTAIAQKEVGPASAVFLACFLVSLPLGIIKRIQMGFQEGYLNNIWQALGAVAGLVGVFACIRMQLGLPAMVLAFAGGPLLAELGNAAHVWGCRHPDLQPRRNRVSAPIVRRILNVGFLFFLLQLSMAFAFSADNLIVSQMLGADTVSQYGVPQRFFSVVSMLFGILLTPLWPAYGEALARQDVGWVKITLRRTQKTVLFVIAPLSALMVLYGKTLIGRWVDHAVQPSFLLLLGFGLWVVLSSYGNSIAMFLNGAGIVRFQAVAAVIMSAANVALSIYLTHKIGVAGPIWGTVLSYLFVTLIPVSIHTGRLLKKMKA